jgi:hypothetical protein
MKKAILTSILCLIVFAVFAQTKNVKPPFIGKKEFDDIGNRTVYIITISKDNSCKIQTAYPGVGSKSPILYKGRFKQIIKVEAGKYLKIEANRASFVNSKGKVLTDCFADDNGDGIPDDDGNSPCVFKYFK